jgi:hypothetical protein
MECCHLFCNIFPGGTNNDFFVSVTQSHSRMAHDRDPADDDEQDEFDDEVIHF